MPFRCNKQLFLIQQNNTKKSKENGCYFLGCIKRVFTWTQATVTQAWHGEADSFILTKDEWEDSVTTIHSQLTRAQFVRTANMIGGQPRPQHPVKLHLQTWLQTKHYSRARIEKLQEIQWSMAQKKCKEKHDVALKSYSTVACVKCKVLLRHIHGAHPAQVRPRMLGSVAWLSRQATCSSGVSFFLLARRARISPAFLSPSRIFS